MTKIPHLRAHDRQSTAGIRAAAHQALPGLTATVIVALAATYLSDHYHAPPVIFALLLGMALNALAVEQRYRPGIDLSARALLRVSVALLGLRITFGQVGELGWSTAALVVTAVPATIAFGWALARTLKLDSRLGVLSGGAVGVCGASAAMAIAVAWPRKESERDTALVIACVTTLSTVAMVLYPALLSHLHLDALQSGRFLGASIHDVAQVVAAGYATSPTVGDTATIVKLMRVAMLLPVVLTITMVTAQRLDKQARKANKVVLVPWFLMVFVALAALNGMHYVPATVSTMLTELSRWLLVISVAALGMKTSARDIMSVGACAIGLIAAETVFLALLVLAWILLGY